ncbi:YqaJ viral recombinase family protein [Candidatus Babeliales bacterium]|nr:YqaJ viral recombinase family protein [Candidatus Babeliales bacterium]
MIELKLKQQSEEWYQARLGKVSGSRMKLALGSPKVQNTFISELIAEQVTEMPAVSGTSRAMERGNEIEPFSRAHYKKITGIELQEVGMCIHEKYDWLTNSPDGLTEDRTHAGEFKSPDSKKMIEYIRYPMEAWKDYGDQVINYFMVNEKLETLDFVLYDPRIKLEKYQMIIKHYTREELRADIDQAWLMLENFKSKWDMEVSQYGFKLSIFD